jgi:hypothetical protein
MVMIVIVKTRGSSNRELPRGPETQEPQMGHGSHNGIASGVIQCRDGILDLGSCLLAHTAASLHPRRHTTCQSERLPSLDKATTSQAENVLESQQSFALFLPRPRTPLSLIRKNEGLGFGKQASPASASASAWSAVRQTIPRQLGQHMPPGSMRCLWHRPLKRNEQTKGT